MKRSEKKIYTFNNFLRIFKEMARLKKKISLKDTKN